MEFTNKLLESAKKIGKYELYLDGSTGWGITFAGNYIEVEEGPHASVGWMNAEINGIQINARGYDTPIIPDDYWMGKMSDKKLSNFFDRLIAKYKSSYPLVYQA
jgi:hypothetical protein